MGFLDIILALLLLFGLVRGFRKGLFVELASLVALVAGVYGAIHFSNYAAAYLENHVAWEEKYIAVAAFAITFIIIVLAIALAGKALTKLADFAMLGIVNKILGGLFGVLKTAFILSVLLVVLENLSPAQSLLGADTKNDSALYAPIHSFAPAIFPIILQQKAAWETRQDDGETTETETAQ